MILPINEKYRIEADSLSWMIQSKATRKRDGQSIEEWRSVSWHSSLQSALQGLAERMIRSSDAQTVADAIADVKAVCAELSEALQPKFTVTVNKGAA